MGAVTVGANRRKTICGFEPGFAMHAAEIGRVNIGMALLTGDLLDRCRRTFDDGVRVMAVGTDRSRRIARADQRSMNAGLPLFELVSVTATANLRHRD